MFWAKRFATFIWLAVTVPVNIFHQSIYVEEGYSHRSVLAFAASPLFTFVWAAASSFVSVIAPFSM